MKNLPLVSVIIPSYNHQDFICSAIEAVINQTYPNIELIVIDDGSTDETVSVVRDLLGKYSFQFITQENIGVSATLNKGIDLSTGEYICFCSSDDFFHKDRVSKQIEFLENNTKYGACFSGSYVINDNNEIITDQTCQYNLNITEFNFEDVFTFKINVPITGMYKKMLLLKNNIRFDSTLTAEDYDFNLLLLKHMSVAYIKDLLYYYRSPSAEGGDRVREIMRIDVSDSHYHTIQKHKYHRLYNVAKSMWNYRCFTMYAGYSKHKLYAIKGMLYSTRHLFNKSYLIALLKLILIWKK